MPTGIYTRTLVHRQNIRAAMKDNPAVGRPPGGENVYTWRELNAVLRAIDNSTEALELWQQATALGLSQRWRRRIRARYRRLQVREAKRG
jgi:hypothetical protein